MPASNIPDPEVTPQGDNFDKVAASMAPTSTESTGGPGGSMFDKVAKIIKDPTNDHTISPLTGGTVDATHDPKDYNFAMKYGQDNDLLRANSQSWYKQLGLGLANIVPNIATSLVGSLGQLSTLAQFGDDRTYSNALTEQMDKWHNPFGEVYQRNPNATADLTDSAWWIKQGTMLAEMTGQFALLGGGVGGLLEKGATALGEISGSARIARALLGASQVATSAALSYTIGAQMGAEVYKKAYVTNYTRLKNLGYSDGEASEQSKHISAQAAASTVQLNTILGFGLNLTSVLPVFKQSDDVLKFLSEGEGKRAAGESLADYKIRLQAYAEDSPELAHALGIQDRGHYATEAIKQAGEGALMHFSQKAGERQGESGKTKGFFQQFDELGNLLDDVTSGQGILNAVLGVAGGVMNTAVLGRIPLHRDYVRQNGEAVPQMNPDGSPQIDKEGNQVYQTKMYSSRDMAKNQRMAYFENNRDAIVTDIDHIQKSKDKLTEIASSGRSTAPEEAQVELNNLLAVQQLHSISMGLADNLIDEYKDIAKTDNTTDLGKQAQTQADAVAKQQADILQEAGVQDPEQLPDSVKSQFQELDQQREQLKQQATELADTSPAMQKGLTQSMKDHNYVQRAEEAASDVQTFQKWNKHLQSVFAFDSRNAEAHVPEIVLHKMIQNHLYHRLITKMSTDNISKRLELDSMQGPMIALGDFNPIVSGYNRKIAQNRQVGNSFNTELQALHDAVSSGDHDKVQALLNKYKIDYSHGDERKAAIELSHKLADLRDQKYQQSDLAHKNLAESLEYKQWEEKPANSGKPLADYIKELEKRSITNEALNQRENYVEQLKAEHSILQDQINKATSKPSKYAAEVLKDFAKAKLEMTERIKAENAVFNNKEREDKAADNLSQRQKEQATRVYQQKIDDVEELIKAKEAEIDGMKGTETTKFGKLISWVRDPGLTKARQELINLQAQRDFFRDNLSKVYTPSGTPEETASEQELTAMPEKLAQVIVDTAASVTPQASISEIKDNVNETLKAQGVDPATIIPESLDEIVVRTIATNKTANEPDTSKAATDLDDMIRALNDNTGTIHSDISEILEGTKPFSWDALSMQVMMGFLDQPTAAKIMSKVNDILTGSAIAEEKIIEPVEETPAPTIFDTTPEVTTEPTIPEPEEPTLAIPDPPSDPPVVGRNVTNELRPTYHAGQKSTSAAKINRLDLDYKDGVLDSGEAIIKSTTSQLNTRNSEDMLSHGKIIVGSKLKLVVDKEWKGQKKSGSTPNAESSDAFDQYVDKNGKVPAVQKLVDELPIKITNAKGETLGYLPTVSWILAKYPGTSNYRNIAEVVDKNTGTVISNAETEAEKLRAMRQQIVNHFNVGSTDIETTVKERNAGHLIMHVDQEGKSVTKSAKTSLPDTKLEFGVWDNGAVKIGKTLVSSKELNISGTDEFQSQGAPVAVVPMPDGKYSIAPLYNKSLEPHEVTTMTALIEAYLKGDQKIIDAAQKHTGFDISTAAGLRNMINQHYTYTNSFSKAALQPSIDPGATPRFLFNVTNEAGHLKGEVSVGTAYSGRPKITATIGTDSKLDPAFIKAFEIGMKGRYKNIVFDDAQRNIKGLNSNGKLNEVVYSKDVLKIRATHDSYNDYVKSFSETPVDGTNRLSTGEYVYGVHANTILDMQQVIAARPNSRPATIPEGSIPTEEIPKDTSTSPTKDPAKSTFSAEDADLLGNGFMDMLPNFETKSITLDNLKELHTFTAAEQHNGKSPEQVLAEMKRLGLSHIPEDFNPFLKC